MPYYNIHNPTPTGYNPHVTSAAATHVLSEVLKQRDKSKVCAYINYPL